MIKQNYLTYIVLLTFWKNQNLPLKDTLDRRRNYCIWFNHFIIRAKITGNRSKLDYKGNKITPPPLLISIFPLLMMIDLPAVVHGHSWQNQPHFPTVRGFPYLALIGFIV